MDGLGCGWEERSINTKGTASLFWERNPIAAVQYILGHPPFMDQLWDAPAEQMDSNGNHIYAEIWTADSWWKMKVSCLVSPERACQRERVRENMSGTTWQRASESDCQRERVRESVSESVCQREHVTERVSERGCQRERVRECVRERDRERVRERVREHV